MRHSIHHRILPAIAVGALVLAACGSDDDSGSSSGASDLLGHDRGRRAHHRHRRPGVLPVGDRRRPRVRTGLRGRRRLAVGAGDGLRGRRRQVGSHRLRRRRSSRARRDFDFNLQQYSITERRKENIDFSVPYYTSNQAIVALERLGGRGATSVADLKDVKFGAQAGTTSLDFINDVIQPNQESVRLRRQRRRQGRARGEPDRRRGVRPADGAVRVRRRDRGHRRDRTVPGRRRRDDRPVRHGAREGQRADRLRRRRDRRDHRVRRARRHHQRVARRLHRRAVITTE